MSGRQRCVLIIAAHADDEVVGTGGVIQWHKAQGDIVYVSVVANRVIAHKNDAKYIAKTKQSAEKVRKLFKIKKYFFSDLMDEQLDQNLIEVIIAIETVLQTVKPDITYIPHEKDTHQDHRAVAQACKVACRYIDQIRAYETTTAMIQFTPNVYMEITEEVLEKKITAMSYYDSETREYPHPRSARGLQTRAQMRGIECHRNLAEAFTLIRSVNK